MKHAKASLEERAVNACKKIGRAVLVLGLALLARIPKYGRGEYFRPVRLTQLSKEAQTGSWHGTAIVYVITPYATCKAAQQLELSWFEAMPLAELVFRVDRPELLTRINHSAMQHLCRQFEQHGYRVKELCVRVGSFNYAYFPG